jgi:tRNA-specific 2-thiouridylase
MDTNDLVVVQGHSHPALLRDTLLAQDVSWVSGTHPLLTSWAAKTRYRQADAACKLTAASDVAFKLNFEQPQWAITPGQSAVIYDGEICLGGGVISR